MKDRIMSTLMVFLFLTSNFMIFANTDVICDGTSTIFFSDDFNDNELDTSKWTMSVNGSNNAFEEENGSASFTSYGHKSWDRSHTVLWSKILSVKNWENIEISGRWKFTNPRTGEMRALLYNADNMSEYAGVSYANWEGHTHQHLRLYYPPGVYSKTIRSVPTNYVDFRIRLSDDKMEYWEGGVFINDVNTTSLSDATNFKLVIGGYDASSCFQYFYFDEISISTDGDVIEIPPQITISSPESNQTYQSHMIWLNATSDREIMTWYYSIDELENVTFTPDALINVPPGNHNIHIYGIDRSGITGSAHVSFDVEPTSSNAIVGIESTAYGVSNTVGDLMSVHVRAESVNGFRSERLYMVDALTNETINLGFGSIEGYSFDKAMVISILDVNDSIYDLYYDVTDTSNDIVATGQTRISVENARFDILNVNTTFASRIYVETKASLGNYTFTDPSDHFPEDEKGSFVHVTVANNGEKEGAAKLEILLPDYLHEVTDDPTKYIYLDAQETKQYTFYVLLTRFDIVNGWSPGDPGVFPDDKEIPIEVRVSHFPSYSLVDTETANIGFNLGPVFEFEPINDNIHFIWEKNSLLPDRPYDGDGDGVLEAAEGYHFNVKYKNIGDEMARLESITYLEYIPCDSTRYRPYSTDHGYISNAATYYPSQTFSYASGDYAGYYIPDHWDERSTYIFGDLHPYDSESVSATSRTKFFHGGRTDWWPDDISTGFLPPAEYSGDVYIRIQPSYSIPSDPSISYGYYSCSINRETLNVEALEKTFTPTYQTLKDGDISIEVYSVDLDKNTTQIKITNNNEYVYFEYKLDSYYDSDPEGYRWYHTVPPQYKFNVFAEARDPNSTIPHMKAIFGVQWSVWANELKLGLMTLEAALNIILQEVTGGAIEVEFADTLMGITNTLLQIMNVYESYQQGVPPTIRINGITVDLQELADQGLNRQYFLDIVNGDVNSGMITTLVEVLWENEELKEVVGREILKVIANNLGLRELHDLMMDEDTQEQAFDDLLEKLLDYLVDSETITKAQSKAIGDVVSAAKTFMDLGEWAYNNAVSVGSEEVTINIMDPPGEFTTDYNIERTNYFGGPCNSGSIEGDGDVEISLSSKDQVNIAGDFRVTSENLPVEMEKIDHMTIQVEGNRINDRMIGNVSVEIIPEPEFALDAFIAFRNPVAQKNLISSHFESMSDLTSVLEGDRILISGSGILLSTDDDRSIHTNLVLDDEGLTVNIKKNGTYMSTGEEVSRLNLKFRPVIGVPLNSTDLSIKVEEGSRFESSLPFEHEGDRYYLEQMPDEISFDYTPPGGKDEGSSVPMVILVAAIIGILMIIGFFIFYLIKNKRSNQ